MDTLLQDLLLSCAIMAIWIAAGSSREEDICFWNTFNATCPENEVIQMEYAYYGRMSVGRCIPKDLGYIGCQQDVLTYLDSVCSGRQTCQMELPDKNLARFQACEGGLESYLKLKYNCVAVYTSQKPCTGHPLIVRGKKGILANYVTGRSGQGSLHCPWTVLGSLGQTIRLTLHDYGVWTPSTSSGDGSKIREPEFGQPEVSDICRIYARITDGSAERSITICGGERREHIVYSSGSESVQISITDPKLSQKPQYYLLQYEVIGCPKYTPPEGATTEQHAKEISVRCPDTGSEWRVSCDGTQWTSDVEITTCSGPGQTPVTIGGLFEGVLTLPQWILIAIIIVAALIIAVPLLVFGILCFRRRNDPVIVSVPNSRMDTEMCISHPGLTTKEDDPMLVKNEGSHNPIRGREYVNTAQRHMAVRPGIVVPGGGFPPLSMPPTSSMPEARTCTLHGKSNNERYPRDNHNTATFRPPHTEHKYESPKFMRRMRSESDANDLAFNGLDLENIDFDTKPAPDPDESNRDIPVGDPLVSTSS